MNEHRRPSLEEFADELERAVRAVGYRGAIRRDAAGGKLWVEGERALSMLQLYEQLAGHEPARRGELLAKAASMLVTNPTLPATWAETAPLLRVNAKPQIHLVCDEMRRQAGAGPAAIYVANLTPHLALELAVPYKDGHLSVPKATLDGWGIRPEDAFAVAGENEAADLRRPWLADPARPGLFRSPWQDGRDGGRLLFRQVFSALPLHGRPVVMLPTPSTLLVAGSDDPKGLGHMADYALTTLQRTGLHHYLRALCASADGTAWEDWLPPENHPTLLRFRTLQALQEVREASEHAERVAALERANGREALPLPRLELVLESRTHAPMTVTTWRAGKAVALPKADAIVLRRGATVLGIVAWDDVVQTLPGTLTKLAGYPARFLAADFPEDWQLGMLQVQPWKPPLDGPPP